MREKRGLRNDISNNKYNNLVNNINKRHKRTY